MLLVPLRRAGSEKARQPGGGQAARLTLSTIRGSVAGIELTVENVGGAGGQLKKEGTG
jgi:tripartite-type tricarboxylate transporter receptor subunit TctC